MRAFQRLFGWVSTLVLACVVLVHVTTAFAVGALPPPGDYVVDTGGSSVAFNVTNLVVTSVNGKFKTFSGRVTVGDSLATSRIDASVDVRSIDTESDRRDEHLRSADFFDVARFPRMAFTSTVIWGAPSNFGIKGNLTIKGITKEVVFSGRILDTGVILAETKIDRTDFGITSGGTIKNEVRLRLEIRVVKSGLTAPQGV